jgi:hypothetical protein
MDGLWRILFTIPLPLALNATAAERHDPPVETDARAVKTVVGAARAGCVCTDTFDLTVSRTADCAAPSAKAACAINLERGDKSCVRAVPSVSRPSVPPRRDVLHEYVVTFFSAEEVAAFDAQAPPQSRPIDYPRFLHPCARSLPNASSCSARYRGKDHTHTVFPVDCVARFGRYATLCPRMSAFDPPDSS